MDNVRIRNAYAEGEAARAASASLPAYGDGGGGLGFLQIVRESIVEAEHAEHVLFGFTTVVAVGFLLACYRSETLYALPVVVAAMLALMAVHLRVRVLRYVGAFVGSTVCGVVALHADKVLEDTRRHALAVGLGVLAAAWVVHWRVYLRVRGRVLLPAAYAQSPAAALATRALLGLLILGSVAVVFRYYVAPMSLVHSLFGTFPRAA